MAKRPSNHSHDNESSMGGLYFEYVIDYLNEHETEEKAHQEKLAKTPQKSNKLTSSVKDLIKKFAKHNQ